MTNGTTYIVTVIAYTTVGDSGPSAPVTVTPQAQKSASSTLITSITASPVVGQPITTTVRVAGQSTGAGDPTPTGTVTVSDGTRSCQAPLSGNNGVATGSCQITEKSPGPYSFTASYPGDTDFTASTTSSRPHQGIAQRIPDDEHDAPRASVTDIDTQQIRRKPVLGGLINEYMHAA